MYRLIARDTIEDKVMALNARKAKLFASVIDDGNAFGSALNPTYVESDRRRPRSARPRVR